MNSHLRFQVVEILRTASPEGDFWTEKNLLQKLGAESGLSNKQSQEILQDLLDEEVINGFLISQQESYLFGLFSRAKKIKCYSLK